MKKTLFLLSLLSFLFIACENNYDWTNPLDPKSEVQPEDWAPRNLQIQKISDTQIMLTWEQDEKRIEGFHIERKVDNGSWQRLAQLGANERSYTDSGLDTGKTYLYKICAFISGKHSQFSNEVVILVYGTVTDIDGNVYKTVKIGNQWWMAENLRVTRYCNGASISHVPDNAEWYNLKSGAYCIFNNDINNIHTLGLLYNWYAVNDSRNLAPDGWRAPTDDDWKQLEIYLGMSQNDIDSIGWRGTEEGLKLKECGNNFWLVPSAGTNTSGFTALPSGYRNYGGNFTDLYLSASFWSSNDYGTNLAVTRSLYYEYSTINRDNSIKRYGFSVRCVRD